MNHRIIAYAAHEHRPLFDGFDVHWNVQDLDTALGHGDRGPSLVLVGVGAECAALAEALRGHENEARIAAIVLIAPVAPWAEREMSTVIQYDRLDGKQVGTIADFRTPLSALEPLRAWAERARAPLPACGGCNEREARLTAVGHQPFCNACAKAVPPGLRWDPIRSIHLVLTAHPEPVKCEVCGGKGWHIGECHPREECATCSGTGRALGPPEVARELGCEYPASDLRLSEGFPGTVGRWGGLYLIQYKSREQHDREAIGAALRRAIE